MRGFFGRLWLTQLWEAWIFSTLVVVAMVVITLGAWTQQRGYFIAFMALMAVIFGWWTWRIGQWIHQRHQAELEYQALVRKMLLDREQRWAERYFSPWTTWSVTYDRKSDDEQAAAESDDSRS